MSVINTCKSYQNWRRYRVHNIFSSAQGQVTLKSMDKRGRNWNSSEILCLSWLPVSLMMIRSQLKALSCPQLFIHYKSMGGGGFQHSRASYSGTNSPIWLEIETEILCLSSLPASLMKILPNNEGAVHNNFSVISLWKLLVVMETRVLIQSATKPYAHFIPSFPEMCRSAPNTFIIAN